MDGVPRETEGAGVDGSKGEASCQRPLEGADKWVSKMVRLPPPLPATQASFPSTKLRRVPRPGLGGPYNSPLGRLSIKRVRCELLPPKYRYKEIVLGSQVDR